MADSGAVADQQHPELDLSPQEKRLYKQLFTAADAENVGVVTGEVAVKFFEKTRLPPAILGEIWQIADTENRGFLTSAGFAIVLRLIGYAQAGRQVSAELALKPGGPLPRFDGFSIPSGPPPNAIPGPIQPQASGGPIRVPPLVPEKVAQYSALFEESGAQNGLLSGGAAKQIFERAQLPNEVLGRIWNLADTEQKGQLGLTEFIIAMHLLLSFKNGSLRALPQTLPVGLYEAAARRGAPRNINGSRPSSAIGSASAMARQFSGQGAHRIATRPRSPYGQTTALGIPTGSDQWVITPADKVQFDQIFATVDTAKRGVITGEQAVGFFSRSGLPEEALAQIWDLADIKSEGQLTRDEFAVAMYLIRQQKRDGGNVLPQTLPTNLIPPSLRREPIAAQQSTAPAFDNTANAPAQKSASEDLFGLDTFTTPAPIAPKSTGNSSLYNASPTQGQGPPQTLQQPQSAQSGSVFKPFVPSSSFGQAIMTPQATGASSSTGPVQSRAVQPRQPSAMDDLLGDNDPEISKKFTQETTELANLSNQVSTLTGQMQDVKSKRVSTEQNLTQAQSQKREFESRLSQLRSAYELEVREVKALEEQLSASRNEVRNLQQEMAMIEGTHQDLQVQHRQVAAALDADQMENSSLKEKIRESNAVIGELRPQLEKMRSEARQQKGLVAINKKQLATNEAERDKVKGELEAASREHAEATREFEESKRNIEAQPQPRNLPPASSPAASVMSMNPFLRGPRADSVGKGESSDFGSPNVATPNHNAFDSFFGPSLTSSGQSREPPPTSFRTASPSQSREITHSEKSSDGPDVPTPSASPITSTFNDSPQLAAEPPAPPQSRQILSSFLPFRTLERSGSPSSSVNVNRPTSRMGGDSSFDTPEMSLSYLDPTTQGSPTLRSEGMDSKVEETVLNGSASQFASTTISDPNGVGGYQSPSLTKEGSHNPMQPSASRCLPGSFPGEDTQPTISESSADTLHTQEAPQSSRPDPFALSGDRPRIPVSAKDDFDSAFAGFDNAAKAPALGNINAPRGALGEDVPPKAHGEFPPIQEFGADEDSESDSERGFDDDFTTASPHKTRTAAADLTANATNLVPGRPPFTTNESATSQLPTPSAQVSPPTYDQTVSISEPSHRKDSSKFPAEYSGLLPSREDQTTSPSAPPPTNRGVENVSSPTLGQSVMNFFGAGTTSQPSVIEPTPSETHAPMPPGSSVAPYAYDSDSLQRTQPQPLVSTKKALDEFDNEFADLSEAREADDKADEEFGTAPRSGFDEFNPVFDSPNSSRTTGQPPSSTYSNAAFRDFESSISSSAQAGKIPEQAPAATNNHDWDAIFAGLDTPQRDSVQPSSQNNTFPSVMPPPAQNNGIQQPALPPRDNPNLGPASVVLEPNAATQPPPLMRGPSMGTEHDDPILKRLTGMGYPREESLAALEKFDYNIDKAADYLTSKL